MASFGKPGPYGKFYVNHKETPVSNDINYRGALRREYQINDEAAKCPSPWLAKPTAAQMKERTELPIDHPYGGGLRWHREMRTFAEGESIDKTEMIATGGEHQRSIFVITKPFRMGYGDSFGFSIDVEFETEGGYCAVGLAPPDWDWSQSLANRGCACVRSDGAFSTAERAGQWDKSQCHPLLNMGGSVFEPPLKLNPSPTGLSPHTKPLSPHRPPRVRQKALQDGSMPEPGRGRLMVSVAPKSNNLWVSGNDYDVKVPNCKFEVGSNAVVCVEIGKGRVTICRAHDGCTLAEKYSNKKIKDALVNDTRFVSSSLEGPKMFTTSPLNCSGVQPIERAVTWPGKF